MTRPLFKLSLVALAAGSLAACATERAPKAPPVAKVSPPTETQNYQPRVAEVVQDLPLAVHAEGLSPNQQRALSTFTARWGDEFGPILVRTPMTCGDTAAARRMADAVGAYLQQTGVPASRIRLSTYDQPCSAQAVVTVSFQQLTAVLDDCSKSWDNLTKTKNNTVSKQFGCAVSNNIALQIANPSDLLHPTLVDPSDGVRRTTVLDKYRKGQVTSTSNDAQASGSVSAK